MANFTKQDVLAACKSFGPCLSLPDNIDGVRLMAAISSNESSFGANCGPRHEPAYDRGGSVYNHSVQQQKLVDQYGSAAACSYGPWQVMFINCPGYLPEELETNLVDNARSFVSFFNSYVARTRGAKTIPEIGMVYNLGHITNDPPPGVAAYVKKLQAAYDALPVE